MKEIVTKYSCDLHASMGEKRPATVTGIPLVMGKREVELDLCAVCNTALKAAMDPWLHLLDPPREEAKPVVRAVPELKQRQSAWPGKAADPPSARWHKGMWRLRPEIQRFCAEFNIPVPIGRMPKEVTDLYDEAVKTGEFKLTDGDPAPPKWWSAHPENQKGKAAT
jgi:hypothetical protein